MNNQIRKRNRIWQRICQLRAKAHTGYSDQDVYDELEYLENCLKMLDHRTNQVREQYQLINPS